MKGGRMKDEIEQRKDEGKEEEKGEKGQKREVAVFKEKEKGKAVK